MKTVRNLWRLLLARLRGLDAYQDVDGTVRWARGISRGHTVRIEVKDYVNVMAKTEKRKKPGVGAAEA